MTTTEDRRFHAAVAAMSAILNHDGAAEGSSVLEFSVMYADGLIAELARTAPCDHAYPGNGRPCVRCGK